MLLQTPYEMLTDVANRFRNTRKAKRITIKELSKRSGVPYSTIRRFESTGETSFLSFVKMMSAIGEDSQISSILANRVPASIEEVIRENRR